MTWNDVPRTNVEIKFKSHLFTQNHENQNTGEENVTSIRVILSSNHFIACKRTMI